MAKSVRKPAKVQTVSNVMRGAITVPPNMGAPTKYDPAQVLPIVERAVMLGATNVEIADLLEVDVRTFERWTSLHVDLCRALKDAKEACDTRVVRSLFQRAIGYTLKSEKVMLGKGGEVIRVETIEHVQPDVTAQIFWLKNRDRVNWRDGKEVVHSGAVGVAIEPGKLAAVLLAKLRPAAELAMQDITDAVVIEHEDGDSEET